MTTGHIFGYRPGSIASDSITGIVLSSLPTLTAIICFIIPGRTILKIRKQTSTREIPLFPFLSMMLQSLVWLIYGVLKGSIPVALPNVVGFVLGMGYTYIYDIYAIDKDRNTPVYAVALAFIFALAALVLYLPNSAQTVHVLGLVGAVSSVCFMASPLVAILRVIKDKTASSMPFETSLALSINGLTWMLFGYLVANESSIWFPNFLGALAGFTQLGFHALYGSESKAFAML